ncbi:hypothetical protein HAX54_031420 [Datura stramonium]|uniref:Uncharacterized protein n=1 Tax=Datura stramonium TaxID=4076 RepID=A0ABS8V985_DATST|nr:hypothetical protein [Datura stramonium]
MVIGRLRSAPVVPLLWYPLTINCDRPTDCGLAPANRQRLASDAHQKREKVSSSEKEEHFAEMSSQGSEESFSSRIKSMLEVVLEQVVSTDSRIRELRNDLLDLTQKVKDHEVSIRQLKDKINLLPFQMATQQVIKEEKTPPLPTIMEEEAMEWGVEEEILKEMFESILLNSGGWKICLM